MLPILPNYLGPIFDNDNVNADVNNIDVYDKKKSIINDTR